MTVNRLDCEHWLSYSGSILGAEIDPFSSTSLNNYDSSMEKSTWESTPLLFFISNHEEHHYLFCVRAFAHKVDTENTNDGASF